MRSQCPQHLMCYEHTQQNARVAVHGAHACARTHTQRHAHTTTHSPALEFLCGYTAGKCN